MFARSVAIRRETTRGEAAGRLSARFWLGFYDNLSAAGNLRYTARLNQRHVAECEISDQKLRSRRPDLRTLPTNT